MTTQDKFFNSPPTDAQSLVLGMTNGFAHLDARMYFDPKGNSSITEALQFLTQGQLPFGEWMKKLGARDRPPRGRCSKYFASNQKLRRTI